MKKLLFLITFLFFIPIAQAQVITVSTTEYNYEELVTEVLINSPCAIVDNVIGITGVDFGNDPNVHKNGIGYFENTNPDFPMETGVVLTTRGADETPGPNTNSGLDFSQWPGDQQLLDYIQSLGIDPDLDEYFDSSILEFDFRPLTDSISFNFIFASDEYGTYQCTYSDAFAFFLENQDTGEIVNMALVPGTTEEVPISVVTIRDNLYNASCDSANEEYFDRYYGTPNGLPNSESPINFNGHTVLMQAWQYVTPNINYKMKLVIGNRNDGAVDSAVFIEGGSFFIGDADLGGDVTIDNGNALCDYEELVLSVSTPAGSIVTWFFNGEVIPGETSPELVVTEPGTYGVEIQNPDAPDCIITDEIVVEFKDSAIIDLGEDILACDKVAATLDATPENISDLGDVTYEWFFNGDLIVGENGATLEVTEIGDYSVDVTTDEGCLSSDSVSVIIADFTVDLGEDVSICDGESFEIIPVVDGIDPSDATYLWSTGATTFSIVVSTSGNYSVEVTYVGCTEEDDINVNFRNLPEVDLGENVQKCSQDIITLNATPSEETSENVTYTWFLDGGLITGATGATIDVTEAGIYTVEVNDDGCIGGDEIVVSFYANENCVITQGISPNGDGMNDCFDLQFLQDKSGPLELVILNRHGRVVFEQNNYVDQWCGQTNDGEILPVGNYFYVIKLQDEEPRTGYIYLNK